MFVVHHGIHNNGWFIPGRARPLWDKPTSLWRGKEYSLPDLPDKLTKASSLYQAAEHLLWHGGNSMARASRTTGEPRAGCSKRLSSKAAASEEATAYASVR